MSPILRIIALLGCIALTASCAVNVEVDRNGNPEAEARAFMESYAQDLRAGAREAIAARYDRRGAYRVGGGEKTLEPMDSIRAGYTGRWQPPTAFEWHDLSYEVLSDDAVMVVGRFEWTDQRGRVLPMSYTGLLVKQDGEWRIRLEDEDMSVPVLRNLLCPADSARG
jgi:Domain of unknown function (DUF4440)